MTNLEEMQGQISAAAETMNLDANVSFKPMFGGVCVCINGRAFASLLGAGLALKLTPEAQARLLRKDGARRLHYDPDAPESKQYIMVPPSVQSQPRLLAMWVKQSMDFALSLPAPRTKRRADH